MCPSLCKTAFVEENAQGEYKLFFYRLNSRVGMLCNYPRDCFISWVWSEGHQVNGWRVDPFIRLELTCEKRFSGQAVYDR